MRCRSAFEQILLKIPGEMRDSHARSSVNNFRGNNSVLASPSSVQRHSETVRQAAHEPRATEKPPSRRCAVSQKRRNYPGSQGKNPPTRARSPRRIRPRRSAPRKPGCGNSARHNAGLDCAAGAYGARRPHARGGLLSRAPAALSPIVVCAGRLSPPPRNEAPRGLGPRVHVFAGIKRPAAGKNRRGIWPPWKFVISPGGRCARRLPLFRWRATGNYSRNFVYFDAVIQAARMQGSNWLLNARRPALWRGPALMIPFFSPFFDRRALYRCRR